MSDTLDSLIRHFQDGNQRNVIAAGEALVRGDHAGFQYVVDRVAALKVSASITTLVNTSTDQFKGFLNRVESGFEPQAIRFVFGGVLAGVGGAALAEAAGLAAALGVTVLTVKLVAVVLLLWGIATLLPIVWKRVMDKLGEQCVAAA